MKRTCVLLALLLSGCVAGPDYRPPETPVPGQFAEGDTGGALSDSELSDWWTRFGDPQLSDLVSLALAQNPDLEAAAARIREARARELAAGASALPQVDAQASVTRQRISDNAIPLPPGSAGGGAGAGGFGLPGTEFTSWRAGFDASWEIDLFGRTARSVEAARARGGAAVWNRRDLQSTAAAEVASTYFRLRTLQARIAVAEAELAREQRFERLTSAQARGGLVTGQDLERQRSDASTAAAALPSLRAQAREQIDALGLLTGQAPEALIPVLSKPAAVPEAPQVPAGLPSDLLRRRPDIRAAERDLAASNADIGVAVADLYPRFSLTAAPALVSTALASLLEWGSRSFSAGAAIDWPLLDGGRTRDEIAVANARQEQAVQAYRKTVLAALQDVEDALARTRGDRDRLAELADAQASAKRAEEIADTRYRGGLVNYSDVLVAQAARLKLEDQVAETKGALASDSAALFKALGGGWPELAGEGK